jgi:imidazolonepropionase-like amidohydrolase
MKRRIYITVFAMLLCGSLFAQSEKGTYGTFALTNASIQTVTKGVITNGTVVISNGKIAAVGTNVQVPQGAQVID